MQTHKRYLLEIISKTLKKKMVFLGGPRQVGKTTLSLYLINPKATEQHPAYLNWDRPGLARNLRAGLLPDSQKLIIFDEIHKDKKWRNIVKGYYDTEKSFRQFIVTGSARLDYYRRGGDSLANRYRYFRLHPLSLNEYKMMNKKGVLQDLMDFGGFPEPLLTKNSDELRLWQRDRVTRLFKEDLRDLENVKDISLIQHLVELLPGKVGSLLSVKSLREDLEVDHKTAERWLCILENLYYCYRIAPYGSSKIRALKKEKRLYLWDWSEVLEKGPRFENLVASQLLKYCHFTEDTKGHKMELRYLRDTDKREVDFVVLKDAKPEFAVEVKTGESQLSPHIHYFSQRTSIPIFYQVHRGESSKSRGNCHIIPFEKFCKTLNMP